jgi:dTDP-4-dehydrorhamnose reductase
LTKILLLGRDGQVGWELHRILPLIGKVTAIGRQELDLANEVDLRRVVRELEPEMVVNAAAYTDVDKAESEPELAHKVNADAPLILAQECELLDATLIHFSTDYVFDGSKREPYSEDDAPNPLNVYGASKLKGEESIQAVGGRYLILRSSWVYGLRRKSFPIKVLSWSRTQKQMRVVEDQISGPTWCRVLAEASALAIAKIVDLGETWHAGLAGVYHLACAGEASRLEWAREIIELDPQAEDQIATEIRPARSEEFPTPAKRPEYTTLEASRFCQTFKLMMPDWRESLRRAMEGLGAHEI